MNKEKKLVIDAVQCKGCNLCIDFCPKSALSPSDKMNKKAVFPPKVDEEKCNLCGTCTLYCPDFALVMV